MVTAYQLYSWAESGKSEYDVNSYNRFKEVIEACFEDTCIYLQGSYRNSTNIYGNSDIDIVVECYGYYENAINPSKDLRLLRRDLFEAIQGYHNFKFELGNKTIKYKGSNIYSPADIVPCIQYNYGRYQGISLYDHRQKRVLHSFPKQHIHNGEYKNKLTKGSFKKMVRVFKNIRRELIEMGRIRPKDVSSYYVECLLYNVPNEYYTFDVCESYIFIRNWLYSNRLNLLGMKCQNGIFPLFNSYNGWSLSNCISFIEALRTVNLRCHTQ